ncbi:unnamed protein product [Symbiodinium natans]|uniref:DUF7869 domain-containing protein n=1 Tax=Symbiodinium natans TaxID=878477 RepID=A0A812RKI1_9DINO|nr:unnamed protein product [Symbiodinium natans]
MDTPVSLPRDVSSGSDPGDVSLPDDVTSNAGDSPGLLDENVELPPEEGSLQTKCRCKRGCVALLPPGVLEQQRFRMEGLDRVRRHAQVFASLRDDASRAPDGSITTVCYKVNGHTVCRGLWQYVNMVTPQTVDAFRKSILAGEVTAPVRGPCLRVKDKQQFWRVDAWFLELYTSLGEPKPTESPGDHQTDTEHEVVHSDHPLWALSVASGPDCRVVAKRNLNPQTLRALYAFYTQDAGNEELVSESTFSRCWRERWKKFLEMKNEGTGQRCKVCAKFDEAMNQASCKDEFLDLSKQKAVHVRQSMADRNVNVRGNVLATRAAQQARATGMPSTTSFMKMQIDGMDQAKFRCPRPQGTLKGSAYELWRPQLHLTGCTCFGHFDAFFLLGHDQPKDSNMQSTVLARALDLLTARVGLQGFPRALILSVDNTPRESKNTFFAQFAAALLLLRCFDSVEVQYLQAGHTKNELDQRFSSVARVLNDAGALEDDEEFLQYMQTHVRPFEGREVICEKMSGARDFQAWFEIANMHVQGLTSTKGLPEANHLWRFVRREDHPLPDEIECHHPDWQSLPSNPDDVILCLKQFISSPDQSQPPQLFMPASAAEQLTKQTLQPALRRPLSDEQVKEFQKTATFVGKHPWNLFKGEAFLRKLCAENQAGISGTPPVLQALFQSRCAVDQETAPIVAQPCARAAAPRPVRVRRVLKRPAAAKAAAPRAKAKVRLRPAAQLDAQ